MSPRTVTSRPEGVRGPHGTRTPAYAGLAEAMAGQRCVILDGGVTTELRHQHGQDHERLWGIEALTSAPDEVLDVHRRYVDAGADVITTNTWALPTMVHDAGATVGRGQLRWTDIAREGVAIARQAIGEAGRDGECAVAFSVNGDLDAPDGPETADLLARALADDPPDLLLVETLSVLDESLFEVVDTLLGSGLPVWLSFRRCLHGSCGVYGQHWGGPEGDAFGRAARRLEAMGIGALLVNCIPPDHVDGIVSHLRDFTDLALGVYPNLGYYTSAGWRTEADVSGDEYAQMATRWRAEGAQIIGGCCGTQPAHIAATRSALEGVPPGTSRPARLRDPVVPEAVGEPASGLAWADRSGRSLHPLAFPRISRHPGVAGPIAGTYLLWRHLYEGGAGAHRRCADICSGTGVQTVQLALNGAAHVHAVDVDDAAVANTLDNAFRNGVADRVSGAVADVYPWVPEERYELVVANVPQLPAGPPSQRTTHRPTDFWGRGLVDQVLAKLPQALAPEGRALVVHTSVLSRTRTLELLAALQLSAEVVAWELQPLPPQLAGQQDHVAQIEDLTDAYLVHLGADDALVTYLLEIRHAAGAAGRDRMPW